MLAIAAVAASCGDALTDESYEGEPRMVIAGSIQSLSNEPVSGDVYVGIEWINLRNETSGGQVASVAASQFPASFQLALYDEPPLDSMSNMYRPASGEVYYMTCVQMVETSPGSYMTGDRFECFREDSETWKCFVGGPAGNDRCSFTMDHTTGARSGDCGSLDDFVPWGSFGAPTQWMKEDIDWSYCETDQLGGEDCQNDASEGQPFCAAGYSGGASSGYFGTGYIVVFADGDGDGQLNMDEDSADIPLGMAPQHMVLFGKDLTDGARQEIAQSGIIANVDDFGSGFQLAAGICSSTGLDQLEVVDNELVTVLSIGAAVEEACVEIF